MKICDRERWGKVWKGVEQGRVSEEEGCIELAEIRQTFARNVLKVPAYLANDDTGNPR